MAGTFRGFSFKLPTFTVVCPQTGLTFNMRSLTVAEVSRLKSSLTTPVKATFIVNELLWNAIDTKPDFIQTYEDFKKCVTIRDREALLYGCYIPTFGENKEFEVTCKSCNQVSTLNLNLSNMFSMESYPESLSTINDYNLAKITGDTEEDKVMEKIIERQKEIENSDLSNENFVESEEDPNFKHNKKSHKKENKKEEDINKNDNLSKDEINNDRSILNIRERIELPISKAICVIKQPTLLDEENLFKNIALSAKKQIDTLNETLIIDRFEVVKPGSSVPAEIVTDREDILFGYNSLPPQDKVAINDKFVEAFGKYGMDLSTEYSCKNCESINKFFVDITSQFFRSTFIIG